jgi:hypothetical protein
MPHLRVRDDDAGDGDGEVGGPGGVEDPVELRVAAPAFVGQVHATVEHDAPPADGRHHAALPHILTRPCIHPPGHVSAVRIGALGSERRRASRS